MRTVTPGLKLKALLIALGSLGWIVLVGFAYSPQALTVCPAGCPPPSVQPKIEVPHARGSSAPPLYPPTVTVCPEGPPVCDYATLGEAIAAAEPYTLLAIRSGTYPENLVLDKSLRLRAEPNANVEVRGVEPGVPVLTLDVQGEMQVSLEGITFRASPPSGPVTENPLSCFRPEAVCSPGIVVRGTGSLSWVLRDAEITGATRDGIACAEELELRALHVILERVRLTRNLLNGIAWGCEGARDGVLIVRESLVAHNSLVGLMLFVEGEGSSHRVIVERSTFLGNSKGLMADGNRVDLTVQDSIFAQNRDWGLAAQFDRGSSLLLRSSRFASNGAGIVLRGIMQGVEDLTEEDFEAEALVIEGVHVWGNKWGINAGAGWPLRIRSSVIEQNVQGVAIRLADPWVELQGNWIRRNQEWGVTLFRDTCVEGGSPPHAWLPVVVRGEGNRIEENGRGDLCPEDFPWPEDLVAPDADERAP